MIISKLVESKRPQHLWERQNNSGELSMFNEAADQFFIGRLVHGAGQH